MKSSRFLLLPAMAVLILGCGAGVGGVIGDLPNPAAGGSGEPFLASAGDGVWMSWIEESDAGHRVAAAHYRGGWGPVRTIAEGPDFFVNWADFPSLHVSGSTLVAHWLQRGGKGTYDYGVRIAWSGDEGQTWSDPWTPHEDDTPTEHGFVSLFDVDGSPWAAWLDGRAMVDEGGAMSIRGRPLPLSGAEGRELILDGRVCECCQTDAVVAKGVPIVAFRNRGEGEIRNIHVTRRLPSGWTESAPVHDDGWSVPGCPVNGPALAEAGGTVAVAWFTAPGQQPQVNVAFSHDLGQSFGPALRVDEGQPAGRVDVALLDGGDALVFWLERGPGGATILSRRVTGDGTSGEPVPLAATDEARSSGFPRVARLGEGELMIAWTDVASEGRVRTAIHPLSHWARAQ